MTSTPPCSPNNTRAPEDPRYWPTITGPPGRFSIRAQYREPLSPEDVGRLWGIVRGGGLEVTDCNVTVTGSTEDEDVRDVTNRLVDALPDQPEFVSVDWQAGDPQYAPENNVPF